mgnify:CR=1 FL=1
MFSIIEVVSVIIMVLYSVVMINTTFCMDLVMRNYQKYKNTYFDRRIENVFFCAFSKKSTMKLTMVLLTVILIQAVLYIILQTINLSGADIGGHKHGSEMINYFWLMYDYLGAMMLLVMTFFIRTYFSLARLEYMRNASSRIKRKECCRVI